MTLLWYKCKGQEWCDLFSIDLDHPILKNLIGVYILFTYNPKIHILLVGSGAIKDKLNEHKNDLGIKAFAAHGCFVTWAEVPGIIHLGIKRYLIGKLNPSLKSKIPLAIPTKVNLPFELD